MTYEEQFYPILKDLVPSNPNFPDADGKVYPNVIPEGQNVAPPYIVHQLVNADPENTLDGYTGHNHARVQVSVFDTDFDNCLALAKAVIWRINERIPTAIFIGRHTGYDDNAHNLLLHSQIVEFYINQTDC